MINQTLWIICGGIILAGVIIFFILSWSKKTRFEKNRDISNYEERRDELTFDESIKEEVEEEHEEEIRERSYSFARTIGRTLGLVITLFVFDQIIGTIRPIIEQGNPAAYNSTITVPSSFQPAIGMLTGLLPIIGILGASYIMMDAFKEKIINVAERPKKKEVIHYTKARDKLTRKRKKKTL